MPKGGAPAVEPTSDLPLLLTLPETAELLKLGLTTIYALVAGGRLPVVVPHGKCKRIPRAAVEAFVDELLAESTNGSIDLDELYGNASPTNDGSPAPIQARLPSKPGRQARNAQPA